MFKTAIPERSTVSFIMDERSDINHQRRSIPESAVRRKRSFPTRKRVRWADEERMQKPVFVTVVILNALFLLLGVLARWGLWTGGGSAPTRLEHEIRNVATFPAMAYVGAHKPRHWLEMSRRQAAPQQPGNGSMLPALQTFQVDVPLLGPNGSVVGAGTPDGFKGITTTTESSGTDAGCQVTLAVNVFATSFGMPFVGDYMPPDCLGASNTVLMNLTVTSKGRQFDRLSIVYLGDTEIFRTSTEEPRLRGVSWTYMKDVSQYMALWKQPQKVIFDLPNIIDENGTPPINGTYNTTLTAYFFSAPLALTPADTIIPISARQSNNNSQSSVFTIPDPDPSASTLVTDFPRNAARAIFSVSATGQANEEFWWSNVLQSAVLTYNASVNQSLFGYSPFREVQVLIDGQLAGVQWPFPVIFTGGVVPSFWTPMVGIDAFDLKEGEIDISPWLGILCDGKPHNFSMNVVGLDDDGGTNAKLSAGVGNNWQLTGKIFIWLDKAESVTTGAAPTISGATPNIAVSQSLTKNATGFNDTLRYTTSVTRQLSVSGSITTSRGTRSVSWTQTLSHTDDGTLSDNGGTQLNTITTQGTDASTYPEGSGFSSTYSYPLSANVTSTLLPNGTTRLDATLSRTKSIARGSTGISPGGLQLFAALPATKGLVGQAVGTSWDTRQSGQAVLLLAANGTATASWGAQGQRLRFGGASGAGALGDEPDAELYFREVSVDSGGAVLNDTERLAGQSVVGMRPPATGAGQQAVVGVAADVMVAVDRVWGGL